jgi:hypothetical protein
LHYATGPRAAAILNVSPAWWGQSGAYCLRYEDLVADTAGQLSAIVSSLGAQARKDLHRVVASSTPEAMRGISTGMHYHVWHARPGLWRSLLTARIARQICAAHQQVMDALQYACDPDESLDEEHALESWQRLEGAALKRAVHGLKTSVIGVEVRLADEIDRQRGEVQTIDTRIAELQRLQAEVERQNGLLARHQALISQQRSLIDHQRAQLEALSQQFADQPWAQVHELAELGPWSIGPARAAPLVAAFSAVRGRLQGRRPLLPAAVRRARDQ